MKAQCPEKGCGSWIQTEDKATLDALLADHVEKNHGSVEQRHMKTLKKLREEIGNVLAGTRMSKSKARELYNEVSDLLKAPRAQEEIIDAGNSSVSVHETLHADSQSSAPETGRYLPAPELGTGQTTGT